MDFKWECTILDRCKQFDALSKEGIQNQAKCVGSLCSENPDEYKNKFLCAALKCKADYPTPPKTNAKEKLKCIKKACLGDPSSPLCGKIKACASKHANDGFLLAKVNTAKCIQSQFLQNLTFS